MKPHILFASADKEYIFPLVFRLLSDFGKTVDFEVASQEESLTAIAKRTDRIDLLILDELNIDDAMISCESIAKVLILTENKKGSGEWSSMKTSAVYRYSTLDVLHGVIATHCSSLVSRYSRKNVTQTVMVTSVSGGAGKSLVAFSLARSLNQVGNKAIYISMCWDQDTGHFVHDPQFIDGKTFVPTEEEEPDFSDYQQYVARDEGLVYFPLLNSPLYMLKSTPGLILKLIRAVAESNEYNYIIVDTDTIYDSYKSELIDLCSDMVFVLTHGEGEIDKLYSLMDHIDLKRDRCYFIKNKVNSEEEKGFATDSAPRQTPKYVATIPVINARDSEKIKQVITQPDFLSLGYLMH